VFSEGVTYFLQASQRKGGRFKGGGGGRKGSGVRQTFRSLRREKRREGVVVGLSVGTKRRRYDHWQEKERSTETI